MNDKGKWLCIRWSFEYEIQKESLFKGLSVIATNRVRREVSEGKKKTLLRLENRPWGFSLLCFSFYSAGNNSFCQWNALLLGKWTSFNNYVKTFQKNERIPKFSFGLKLKAFEFLLSILAKNWDQSLKSLFFIFNGALNFQLKSGRWSQNCPTFASNKSSSFF